MIKKRIEKGNTYIDAIYDETKYQIEHVKNSIILRRLLDNQTLEVFNHNIGFIVEYDDENKTHFIITDYSEYMEERNEPIMLKHYVDFGNNELELIMETSCNDTLLESIQFSDCVYSTGDSPDGVYLYNLKSLSKKFSHVYLDKRLTEMFGYDIILVDEVLTSWYRSDILDTITYGIDPNTFEIITPIYSELQNRYIEVYTNEQIEQIDNNLKKQGKWLNRDRDASEITIELEIKHYLNELTNRIPKANSVYLNSVNNEINKEFVKKFIKKNK